MRSLIVHTLQDAHHHHSIVQIVTDVAIRVQFRVAYVAKRGEQLELVHKERELRAHVSEQWWCRWA